MSQVPEHYLPFILFFSTCFIFLAYYTIYSLTLNNITKVQSSNGERGIFTNPAILEQPTRGGK